MHADELRRAVDRIVAVLKKADILAVIRQYRVAVGDQRPVAAARLGHAGAVIMENMDNFSAHEKAVVSCMHLDSLGSTQYWQSLLESAGDPKKSAAELVHLYSRVMFASSHLPNLSKLLDSTESTKSHLALSTGEGRLAIRLTDAGERAADPDRVARSIDGIDMLYSACASIARKPAMDLRLDGIDGQAHRDTYFTGEHDSIAAVTAVLESIPGILEELGPDEDTDLNDIVSKMPIFEDLKTLADLGTFSANDLKDITETMHQGALLVLESGVIVLESSAEKVNAESAVSTGAENEQHFATHAPPTLTQKAGSQVNGKNKATTGGPAGDEHYQRYLREREAMQRQGSNGLDDSEEQSLRSDAVDELLKNLGRARGD